MEHIFENTYKRTQEVAKETMQYFFFRRPRAVVYWSLLVLLTVLALTIVIWTGYFSWEGALYFAFVIVVAARNLYNYRRSITLSIARDREQYGEEPVAVHTFFSQTGVGVLPQAGEPVEMAYENIKYAAQTKHLILLRTKAKLYHMVHKDGFTKGSPSECLAFLKEKGVKIR